MDFNYKNIPYNTKLEELLDFYQTSVALSHALGITRMTLMAWQDKPEKIKIKNQDKIDLLWCQYVLLPKIDNQVQTVEGIALGDFLHETARLEKSIKKMSSGSLEIETGTKETDFNLIINNDIVPNNFRAKEVLEVQNIYYLTKQVSENYQQKIDLKTIKLWHKDLMTGLLENAGEFSTKQRVLDNVDTMLTHPNDIEKELENWTAENQDAQSLSAIAKAHYNFEIIHPFSDGNGRIGRIIMLAQCLQNNIKPPIINNDNKALYYILLDKAKTNPTPLAYFLKACSKS
ncbi:Fic family protein [Candidatus Thioglobus sp.]|uniref:Fic family protein n=1 Tax=Candidatus Thioglobus sp. TaxID=2026721 RepID=UPI003D111AFB